MGDTSLPHQQHLSDLSMGYIAAALRLMLWQDEKGQRAVDRAREIVQAGLPMEFDGTELRVASFSRGKDAQHVTNGEVCTCEAGVKPWCRHRAVFRLLLAYAALRDPVVLISKIWEQHEPTVTTAALPGPTFDELQAAVDALFEQ